MYVHEFQAKEILREYRVPVPAGGVARRAEQAEDIARELRGTACVVKAQVLAGGRGKAGGIRPVRSIAEAKSAAVALLGSKLVTYQTGSEGKTVRAVLVEEQVRSAREIYLAVLVDRTVGRVAIIGAAEGGADIEEAAAREPERIRKLIVDPTEGLQARAALDLAGELGLEGHAAEAASGIMAELYRAFLDLDANLIEINPLALTEGGDLIAVDVKMGFDDNALFRHPEIAVLRDSEDVDPSETEAARYEINYVRLDGNIGCMVNGAGLALATLDLLKQHGGEPADFMDVRPVATRQQIATGFSMILRNPNVRAILVNMYGGGILRCDTMAEGMAEAIRELGLKAPLIVRAAGTNREIAQKVLTSQGVSVVFADDMERAADAAVKAAQRRG